ncbi:hypothetical protein POM88_021179 [Heracleum sosnowskyi]|uniref:Uncharacterized protein n=1 Tax=Heracleum sosnowskyi TaxID=360622 RepID=A0AAD8IEB1_9APIA|nr:hypothetical protein POM88_021179 [Heracleum sosnowskyi]
MMGPACELASDSSGFVTNWASGSFASCPAWYRKLMFQRKVPSSSSQSTDFLKAVEEAILYDFGCNGACDVVGHKPNHDSTASRHFDKARLDTTKFVLFCPSYVDLGNSSLIVFLDYASRSNIVGYVRRSGINQTVEIGFKLLLICSVLAAGPWWFPGYAVYNLQWRANGVRLLVVEFVEPQEVQMQIEAPPPADHKKGLYWSLFVNANRLVVGDYGW